jgi:hypothetical protein
MGDWCSKADIECNENLRSGEEMVADNRKRKKTLFTNGLLRALDRWPLMGDPHSSHADDFELITWLIIKTC